MDKKIIVTKNSVETKKLGYDFGKTLKKGDVVCLYGNLGGGKTTFVQGLAKGLGIKQRIISPTFVLVREHRIMNHESPLRPASAKASAGKQGSEGQVRIKKLYHIDLYRIERDSDIRELGLEEIIKDKESIVAIEWAEKLSKYLPEKRIDIEFLHKENNIREVTFSSP